MHDAIRRELYRQATPDRLRFSFSAFPADSNLRKSKHHDFFYGFIKRESRSTQTEAKVNVCILLY